MQDHCWNYILRNWHLLQRTPTFKTTLPVDARQRLTAEVKDSLINITNLESPGDNSQSTGFSVLWDASNTQDNPTGTNALGPDGKRPVSKATEKRRQRLLEQQLQQQRQYEMEQQKARRAKFRQDMADARKSSSAAAAGSSTAETASDANLHRQDAEVPVSRQQSLSGAERPLPQQANAATPARQSSAATQQTGSSASASARRASRPSRDVTAQPSAAARCQSQTSAETRTIATVQTANSSQVSRRQSAPDLAATSQNSRPSSRTHSSRPSASIPRPGVQRQAAAAGEDLHMQAASGEANLHAERDGGARQPSADLVERSGQNGPGQIRPASSQVSQQHQPPVRSCSQLQQLRRLSLDSKPRFR